MNHDHSSARTTYQPTIIDNRLLLERLAVQLAFLRRELQRGWFDFKNNPLEFATRCMRIIRRGLMKLFSAPNTAAVITVISIVFVVLLVDKAAVRSRANAAAAGEQPSQLVYLDLTKSTASAGIGKNGSGRVGFQSGTGEGSGPTPRPAQGGGGGGDHRRKPGNCRLPQTYSLQYR
jgi:hypothetical protein